MKYFEYFCCFVFLMTVSGCVTKQQAEVRQILNTSQEETTTDALSAMESVVESFTKEELTEEDMKRLAEQLRHDKEAQSAVKSIADGMQGGQPRVKYSPATGKRYSAELEYDPETGVKLLPVE